MSNREQLKKEAAGATILYVEDEKQTQEKVAKIFELFFKEVTCADNGRIALQKYQNNVYDLVVTDLTMPEMGGIELIEGIKAINPSQRIVVITAHNNNEEILGTINLQVDGFLLKPIGMDKLIHLLSKIAHEIYLERKDERMMLDSYHDYFNELSELRNILLKAEKASLALMGVKNLGTLRKMFGAEFITYMLSESRKYLLQYLPEGSVFYQWSRELFVFYYADDMEDKIQSSIKEFFQIRGIGSCVYKDTFFPIHYASVIVTGGGLELIGKINGIQDSMSTYMDDPISVFETNQQHAEKQKNALLWVRKTITALKQDSVLPFYQPIFHLPEQKLYGYEVLARIEEGGVFLEPRLFIEPSEKAGIVEDISEIIYQKSFKNFTSKEYCMHFNVSEEELRSGFLVERLSSLCQEYELSTQHIVLEINYRASYIKERFILSTLRKLRALGYKILIENVSETQLNLQTLKSCMPHIIKVDHTFLLSAFEEENARNILEAFLLFAKKLDIKTAAMGVENESLLSLVRELGFDYAQGYFLGLPSAGVDLQR